MELIYLWIGNYKNIQNQGFSFSPRFECDFDKEKNELTIKENKEYNSIFPNNINITAIVGENGSGKSSVLEVLFKESNNKNIIIYIDNDIFIIKSSFLDNDNIRNYSKKSITIQKEYKLNFSYINISSFVNDKISEDVKFIHLNKEFGDERYYYDHFDQNKRIKILKTYINYIHIFNFKKFQEFCKKYLNVRIKDIEYIKLRLVNNEDIDHIKSSKITFADFLKSDFLQDKVNITNEITELLKKSSTDKNSIIIDIENAEKLKDFLIGLRNIDSELLESFELIYLNKNTEPIDFSSGEQILFFYMMQFEQISSNILIIDEIDLYLHPNLQKSIFSILLNNIKHNVKHIVIATHSPFILSDIPKENIIFLKKGKQVYPDIETFGANIHTLLSHGFFMEDGLMGEFAKEKINKVITLLNKSKLNEKDAKFCENIISITGEPILKRQMQKMLDSKKIDYIAKDTKDAKEEIELLKHKIDILSKRL